MQNIKRHVDELMALINSSIEAKDLMVKILSGLHEEYKDLAFAIQACENLILFSELHEKLLNFQARFRKEAAKHPPLPASTNPTTKLLQFNKKMACLNQTSLGNNLTIANPRHGLGEWTLPLLSTLTLALVGDPTKDTVSYVNNKIILQNSALPVNTCSGPINFVLGHLTTTTDMLPSPFRELTFPLN